MSKYHLRCIVGGFAISLSASCQAVDFKPFDGFEGYQEIKVTEDTYYVAFHGGRDAKYDDIVLAWAARSAQLCSKVSATHYVQLAHLLEPLTEKERALFLAYETEPRLMFAAGGFVYIPMYIPSGPRSTRLDAPSKMAPVRCFRITNNILSKERLVPVSEKLKEATQAGISLNNNP